MKDEKIIFMKIFKFVKRGQNLLEIRNMKFKRNYLNDDN